MPFGDRLGYTNFFNFIKNKKDMIRIALLCFVLLLAAGCGNYDLNKDGISTGKLKVGVDNSYSLMMDSQIFVFKELYKHADVIPSYAPEGDVIQALLDDSIQAAVICRPLNEKEMDYFKSKQRFPESTKIAIDAVAFIVHPDNKDTVFTMQQLTDVFAGKSTTWKSATGTGAEAPINIVFDNAKSCNERTIREKLLNNAPLPANCYAVSNNEEVIKYVSENKNALGVISVSWISDKDDPTAQSFLDKIKVVGLIDSTNEMRPTLPRRPFQSYVFDETYPLRREVYFIRTGLKGTLGTGFASFLAGEKGQLIIHKMGMVAANAPTRTVKITD